MTTAKADELSDWLFAFASGKAESIMLCRAAAELRRLSAVEAERDELKLAFAHAVRLVQDWKQSAYAMEAERDVLLKEKHTLTHQVICCGVAATHPDPLLTTRGAYAGRWNSNQAESVRQLRAERDALRAALADAAQSLETIAKNAGKKLDSEGQENMLAHHDQVRGYANSRAGAARAAMKGTT